MSLFGRARVSMLYARAISLHAHHVRCIILMSASLLSLAMLTKTIERLALLCPLTALFLRLRKINIFRCW